jgi:hypothetical protein
MKKATFILAGIFLVTIALTSCRKDYVCSCDHSYNNETYNNTTRASADISCTAHELIEDDNCTLK